MLSSWVLASILAMYRMHQMHRMNDFIMSLEYHPKTDAQTEMSNHILELMLRFVDMHLSN